MSWDWASFILGYWVGMLIIWMYFRHVSGLHRTTGEFYLAKMIGDDEIDQECRRQVSEEFARSSQTRDSR